jgi:hypothetical protein
VAIGSRRDSRNFARLQVERDIGVGTRTMREIVLNQEKAITFGITTLAVLKGERAITFGIPK